ncbi:hypothetical protein CRUP_001329 [Coryphaenoides rupestris]|nr:hypothetical protein CRUP_001329 [Coryphaenoides rupestris]
MLRIIRVELDAGSQSSPSSGPQDSSTAPEELWPGGTAVAQGLWQQAVQQVEQQEDELAGSRHAQESRRNRKDERRRTARKEDRFTA